VLTAMVLSAAALMQMPAAAHSSDKAQLSVRVVDQTKAVLPSATVTIYTLDGKPGTTVTADAKGIATFPAVATGLTQVVVKSQGFASRIEKLTLVPGENAQTVTLPLAAFQEKVTVRATPKNGSGS